jgi:uracil-DNA glycosylase family 4
MTAPILDDLPGSHHATAMAAGARCDTCSLKNSGRGPVPPSLPARLDLLVVAEAPGATEVASGKTLWGASGREIRQALQSANAQMAYVGFTNACLCWPPAEMKKYLQQCKKQGLVSPIDACRPRLDKELARASFVILMGGASLQAAGVKSSSVMKLRGTPLQTGAGRPGLAIPHAAFVMRDEGRTFRSLFHADVKKAVRIAYNGSTWRDPWYFVPRTSAEVENFLANRQRSAVDVETDGIDAWTCGLRRVGIGDDKEVMIYSPLSVRGHMLLPQDEITAQTRAMSAYFQRAPQINTHNGIVFDSVLLWRYGMPLRDDTNFDGLVAHQVGPTSELPHALDFLGSMYTDAPRWKDDVKHSAVHSDDVLDRYLSYDIAVTYASDPYLKENLRWSQQEHIYTLDHELFRIGRSMSMLGLYVDEQKRWEFAAEYQVKATKLLAEFTAIAGREVNPNAPQQIRQLLYKDLGLPYLEEHTTDSGDPSTDESTLLALLGLGVDAKARKIIHAILGCREAEKILGTYTGHIVNGELEGGPIMHVDGCVRPVWRPGKRSGRWGSNDPNAQNIITKLRAMYVAKPGNMLVAADMSAVELRMIAMLADDEPLLKAFSAFDAGTGPDVHIFNACTVFRCTPEQVTKKVRDFIKRFVYAMNYDAEPPRIYQTLSLLRDDNLQPLFGDITLAEVERLYNLWWQLHPAIVAWKKKLIQGWRSRGYIGTRIGDRRRFFIGGEKATEMPNHDVQGSSAGMQNESIRALVAAYPFDYVNHRGLLVNGHDQLVVECAAGEVEHVKGIVKQVMQKRIGGMNYPAEPRAGHSWKDVS